MITASEARALSNKYNDTIGIIDMVSKEIEEVAKRGENALNVTLVRTVSQENLMYIQDKFTEADFECIVGCDPYRRQTKIEVRWT